jgi:hypothetical protein
MYQLSLRQIDLLNLVFVLGSAVVAFAIPFELFLFSYAFLGPLHYLTEISWLHHRDYFTKIRFDPICLWILAVLSMGAVYLPVAAALTYVTFWMALIFAVTDKPWVRAMSSLTVFATSPLLARSALFQNVFGILLPTLIHVFLFTLLFIFVGVTKKRTLFGIATLLAFISCSVVFFLYVPSSGTYAVSEQVRSLYRDFVGVNYALMNPLRHWVQPELSRSADYIRYVNHFLFEHPFALAIMRFIAFSYTYHYLNWFSKTHIIGWHLISRRALFLIGIGWIACVGLYCCNYRLGLITLLFLSFAHVVLEFPLNHLTAIQLCRKLGRIFWPGHQSDLS